SRWADAHASYAAQIVDYFAPTPVFKVPLFPDEVVGIERLGKVSETLFDGRDPAERFVDQPPLRFEKIEDRYRLTLGLPFAEKGDVNITRHDNDLVVRMGAFKRHVALPRALVQHQEVR